MIDARGVREKKHGVACGLKLHALKAAREKTVVIVSAEDWLIGGAADHHDIRRQILAGIAESVVHPRSKGRASRDGAARLDKSDGGVVVDGLGLQRFDEAQFVHYAGGVRHQLADPRAAFAMLRKFVWRAESAASFVARHQRHALCPEDACRNVLSVQLVQHGLVVEKIDVTRAAGLEEVDDAFCLRCEVWSAEHAVGSSALQTESCGDGIGAEEIGQRHHSKARGRL